MSDDGILLRTARLRLRFVGPQDVGTLTAYRNDPRVARLQDWELPYPPDRAQALVAEHEGLTDFVAGGHHQVAIELDGTMVGDVYVGLHAHGGIADIGYSLIPRVQGRGIATEAVSAIVDDLVDRLEVHRVVAELSPQNLASARLLERLGMVVESQTSRSFWWRGTWDDNLHYAMSDEQRRTWRDRPLAPPERVDLVDITRENRKEYAALGVHHSQQRFVASVKDSYTDALFPDSWDGTTAVPVLRGVVADGIPAGFLMEDATGPMLWRFLIDRAHQGRGIGRRALQAWVEDRRREGHRQVQTSWVPGRGGPEPFYLALGFVPTGRIEDGEVVAALPLRQ